MQSTLYLVVQSDLRRIFGAGYTEEEAWKDADEWTDGDRSYLECILARVPVDNVADVDPCTPYTALREEGEKE